MKRGSTHILGTTLVALLATLGGACDRTLGSDSAICGDGIREGREACDATDLAGESCQSLGYSWGELVCAPDCTLDTAGCVGDGSSCGNGVVEGDEECDQWDLGGQDCAALGFTGGELYCSVTCTFETAWCTSPLCGDGLLSDAEECDDGNLTPDDGCSGCLVEPGWQCTGEPSLCCSVYFQGPHCTDPCVVHVDASAAAPLPDGVSWGTAFETVQEGVDAAFDAGPGCEVWVAEGTYAIWSTAVTDTLALRPGTLLYGGFTGTETERSERDGSAHPTILDGRSPSDPADRVRHVVSAEDVPWAMLDGFVITGGDATDFQNGDATEVELVSGGGLYVTHSELEVANSRFEDNRAERGGAIAIGDHANINIRDSHFDNNRAVDGGALSLEGLVWGPVVITGCGFNQNEARKGGAIHTGFHGELHEVSNSTFEGNVADEGGAIYVYRDLSLISSSVFANNLALRGGAISFDLFSSPWPRIEDSVFVGNSAGSGGAIYKRSSLVQLTRVVLAGNEATGQQARAATLEDSLSTGAWELEDVVFTANHSDCGPGAISNDDIVVWVARSAFAGNSSGGGACPGGAGAINTSLGAVFIHDTLFVGNHGVSGGAVGATSYWGQIQNTTFVANVADANSGAIRAWVNEETFFDNIVWGNEAPQWPQIYQTSWVASRNCIVQGGFPGTGNLDQDPLFVGYPTPVTSGVWGTVTYDPVTFQTRLEDPSASWTPQALAGRFVKPSAADPRWLWIADNDATGIIVWADMTGWIGVGDGYAVYDLRLSQGSPAIDMGDDATASATDFYGNTRYDVPGVGSATSISDIGAIEYQP